MKKVKLRPIIKHDVGSFIVPYLVPSWCSSCPPDRHYFIIKSKEKPTKEQVIGLLELELKSKEIKYEIED